MIIDEHMIKMAANIMQSAYDNTMYKACRYDKEKLTPEGLADVWSDAILTTIDYLHSAYPELEMDKIYVIVKDVARNELKQ